MNRREFFNTSALAVAGASLGLRAAPVAAGDGAIAGIATARTFPIGAARVTAFSDGFLQIGAEMMQGIPQEGFTQLLRDAHLSGDTHPTGVNAYLIEIGTKRILVDAGTGTVMGPGLGHLAANMAALGVDPSSVDKVIATHLHPDHIGGIATAQGNPYGNASLVTGAADIDFWSSADFRAQAPEGFKGFFDLATGTLAKFGDRVEAVSGAADLGDGLTAVPLPGHTPGHMGVMLESQGDSLLIWGDIVHVGPVQFARPDVTIGFDTDADLARKSRISILDQAATDRLQVAGMHIGFPGMGYLERAQTGYRFVPSPYPYG